MDAPLLDHTPLHHAPGRRASWFELFFDLIFVAAVATLTARLAEHYDARGALAFAGPFLILWWLWLGHTFHASRFDQDRWDQRLGGFAQMLAVVVIGFGAGDAFGERAWAFAGGVAAFKALLAAGYARERGRPGLRRLCDLYSGTYALQAALWATSVLADPPLRYGLWALAFALDVGTPFLVARETVRAPPHPEHLPERFGLFTIILLGETAASAVHALDHGEALTLNSALVAGAGAALGLLFWWGYFQRAQGQAERQVSDASSGRRLRLWAYGHIPLYLGIAALGAGTVYLAHHAHPSVEAAWLYAGGGALAMVGVTLVSLGRAQDRPRSATSAWPFLVLALLTLLLPLLLGTAAALAGGLVALASAQVALSTWRRAP